MAATEIDPLAEGRRQARRWALSAIAANLLVPLLVLGGVAAGGGRYAGEESALGWLSSVQLLSIAAVAWCNERIAGLLPGYRHGLVRWIWIVFALGFSFLAIDERFEWHETLRDRLLVPRGVATTIGWLEPGDVGLLAFLLVGSVFAVVLIGELRESRLATGLFAAALGLAALTALADSLREETADALGLPGPWDGALLDVAQLHAQLLFLLGFLVLARRRLDRLAASANATIGAALVRSARDDVRRFAWAMVAVNLLLPLGFALRAALGDAVFYEMFWGERDPISWFSGVQLLIVALAAYAVHAAGRPASPDRAPSREWLWFVFAAGFGFLALDERFELHELLRERVFEPAGWTTGVPGLRVGDLGLLVYLALGLGFAWLLLRELRSSPPAPVLFVAALGLSALIVVEDALDPAVRDRLPLPGFWDSAFEEVGEIWAQLLFLLAFLVVLRRRLDAGDAHR